MIFRHRRKLYTFLLSAIRDSLFLEAALLGMLLCTELNVLLRNFHSLALPFPPCLSIAIEHLDDDVETWYHLFRAHGVLQEIIKRLKNGARAMLGDGLPQGEPYGKRHLFERRWSGRCRLN